MANVQEIACSIRQDIIKMLCSAKSGHPGGSLSAADIVAALYFSEMNIDPQNPDWPDRDRFVLTKDMPLPYCMQRWRRKDISRKRNCSN
jgi:transketolase